MMKRSRPPSLKLLRQLLDKSAGREGENQILKTTRHPSLEAAADFWHDCARRYGKSHTLNTTRPSSWELSRMPLQNHAQKSRANCQARPTGTSGGAAGRRHFKEKGWRGEHGT
eukprot:1605339-Pyramimonas_sp.AAC.1